MPVRKVKGGFKCGSVGKIYKQKWKAAKQCKAIHWSQHKQHMAAKRRRRI